MKVSLNWIRQYTEIKIKEEDLISKIRSQLGEVESVENLAKKYDKILLAEVIERKDHPDAEKLAIYQLNIGMESTVQVVAGDKTLEPGDKVAYFIPGAKVPFNAYPEKFDGIVTKVKLRGVESDGMMASSKELDISTDHEKVMRIESDKAPGTKLVEVLEMDDTIIDIENKALTNRADCFGLLGIAREIAGIQGIKFTSPEWMQNNLPIPTKKSNTTLPLSIDIQNSTHCPRYIGATISDIEIKESPLWLQSLLVKSGMRPINNIVDITNYIMILTGQPLHAFDYDKLKAKDTNATKSAHIVVRSAKNNETLTTLDGKTHELYETNLLICDSTNPIAIGGIMGGYDTEIDENTKNIVLECANFDMYNIRKSSMQVGIFTDALTRYSKGQDPNQCNQVTYKTIELIEELANGKLVEVQDIYPRKADFVTKKVNISLEKLNSHLGTELTEQEVVEILNNVELTSTTDGNEIVVNVPTFRGDLNLDVDIHEEVGRLIGYDNIKITLPNRSIAPAARNKLMDLKSSIRRILTESSASEILTYNFMSMKDFQKHGLNVEDSYKLTNALSPELVHMRTTLLPSLLDKLIKNIEKNEKSLALYEVNKAHNRNILGVDELPHELELASLVLSIDDTLHPDGSAFYQAKYYVDKILDSLNVENVYLIHKGKLDADKLPLWILHTETLYDANASAIIMHRGQAGNSAIGVVGEISPSSKQAMKLPEYSAGFEIDLEGLLDLESKETTYTEPSIYPAISNDICYVSDADVPYSAIITSIEEELEKSSDILYTISPVDIYQSEAQKTEDMKQTTITVQLRHMSRTLTSSEVEELLKRASRTVRRNTNATVKDSSIPPKQDDPSDNSSSPSNKSTHTQLIEKEYSSATVLDYLSDSYKFTSTASILDINTDNDKPAIILDQTIFYPQGGGQPTDIGEIVGDNASFEVENAKLDKNGVVWHFGSFTTGKFKIGDKVQININEETRKLNARLHSAGHLIDCAISTLDIPEMTPIKGYHFTEGAYIEYKGVFENSDELISKLEDAVNKLVEKDLKTEVKDLNPEEAKQLNICAPEGKNARVVNFEGFRSYGCGGTHVYSTGQIGAITILKIKQKKGNSRISYKVA